VQRAGQRSKLAACFSGLLGGKPGYGRSGAKTTLNIRDFDEPLLDLVMQKSDSIDRDDVIGA
jgi:hypothetical protein